MLRRVAPVGVLAVIIVVVFVLRGGDGSELEDLTSDLNEIQLAFNQGQYGRIYDDFLPASCRARISRPDFVALFGEASPREIPVEVRMPQNVIFDDGHAEFDLSTTAEGPPGAEELSDHLTFVKEDGRWRDTDCFGAVQ